jgi:hypothetical protein
MGMKKYLTGIVIGLLLGLWMGVNIGKERPLWANPFTEDSLQQRAKDVASDAWKDTKKAVRDKLSD